jgi:adenylate cyclase
VIEPTGWRATTREPSPKTAGVARAIVVVLLAGILAGVAYVALTGPLDPLDVARGALAGALIFVPIYLFDVAAANSEWGRRLRRRAFVVAIGLRTLAYLAFIVVGLLLAALATGVSLADASGILGGTHIGFAFLVAFLFNVIGQLSRMLGPSVLTSFVTGRYHRPRLGERVFLFMDLAGSTTIA